MDGNANGKEVIVRKETLVGASRQTEKSNLFWKTNTKKKVLFCETVSWCSYPRQDVIPKGLI